MGWQGWGGPGAPKEEGCGGLVEEMGCPRGLMVEEMGTRWWRWGGPEDRGSRRRWRTGGGGGVVQGMWEAGDGDLVEDVGWPRGHWWQEKR